MVKTTKTARIVISLPEYLKVRLEKYANKHGCSQAEVIRYALIRLMEGKK